jgi:signal transduction histidine kinase
MFASSGISGVIAALSGAGAARDADADERRGLAIRAVVLAIVFAATAVASQASDWQPVPLVLALTAALVAADAASVAARRIRLSAGLLVQTTIMALLGPGPAVAAATASTLVDARINRVSPLATMNNLVAFSVIGLVGGLLFDAIRVWFDIGREDTAYAVFVLPVYIGLAALNLVLVVAAHPMLARGTKRHVLRESVLPSLPLELVNAVLTAVAVFVWARAGLAAAVALVVLLAVTIPLARTVAEALKRGDDLTALQQVSDERAAEVSRLSLDRDRLLTEVLQAEQRERGRLAGSLHDGPMQRLMAMRQDAPPDAAYRRDLDEAIAETRAIISAFHPATVRELGFEASLRAAIAPFPAARSVRLSVRTTLDDRALATSLLLPVAQELVVNAVKHADPSAVAVAVRDDGRSVVLEVDDDGVGIDSARADRAVQAGHLGLAMVRRRVEDAGGQLEIATRPDGGTHSRVVLPASSDG